MFFFRERFSYRWVTRLALAGFACAGIASLEGELEAQELDLAIRNGRIMDPESGRDEVSDLGIDGGRIVSIGPLGEDVEVAEEIDASGLVVAPGFIDILASVPPRKHAHIHKITDGVTTGLAMHGGPLDIGPYRRAFEQEGALVNYGTTVGHRRLRQAVGVDDRYLPARPEQIAKMKELADESIRAGAVGIGFGINYSPGASYEESFALFEVAAQNRVPAHLHARYKGNVFPLTMSLAAIEVIAIAASTGAQAQLAHLASSTVGSMPLCLNLIEGAQRRGVDVGFDFHVWTRNQTGLKSALYDEGWQPRFGGADYGDIYVARTQERLTKERFDELRAAPDETSVQTEFIPESEIEMAIRSPLGIISSDSGGLWSAEGHETETGHPRGTGTFARFFSRYVREREVVSLMEGIKKVTLLPARRMERSIAAMKNKGRIRRGADADITVFDPHTIRERATYEKPYLYSEGIVYVIVNGTLVLRKGEVDATASPGRWLKH